MDKDTKTPVRVLVIILSILVLLIILIFTGTGLLIYFVMETIADSEPANMAIEELRSNENAVELLGEDIEKGFFVSGSIQNKEIGGHAEISIPVEGSRGSGKLFLEAEKNRGEWEIVYLTLNSQGKKLVLIDNLENDTGQF